MEMARWDEEISNQLFEVLEEWNVQLAAMEAEHGPLNLQPDDPGDDQPELSGPGGLE